MAKHLPPSEQIKACNRRLAALKISRSSWDEHWKEARDNIFPWAGNWLDTDDQNSGEKRNDPITTVGREALQTLAAGMQGGLTPRSERWFSLRLARRDDRQHDPTVNGWLDRCTDLILNILAESNFYHVTAQMYEDLGLFGTSCMYIEDDFNTVVTFRHISVGEYWLADDWKGRADTVFREFQISARALLDEFGEEHCSQAVKNMAETQPDKLVTVIHAVFPREGGRETADNPRDMPWASLYYEAGATDTLLRESGFRKFPFLVCRWQVHGEDVYGHSPAMYALADVKQVRDMLVDVADMVGMIARPPLQGPESLENTEISLDPGSVTLVPRMEGGAMLQPVIGYQADAMRVYQVVQEVENKIRNAFHYQIFMMFDGSESKNMTATEVLERRQVRLTQLGPVLERLQTELFGPLIDRIFDRCAAVGILPEVPEGLPEGDRIDIRYRSALAKASDLGRVTNMQQFYQVIGGMAQMPGVLDNLDMDSMVRTFADYLDVPPELLKGLKDVEQARAEQQKQQEQAAKMQQVQQMAEMANTAASATHSLGSTDMSGGNSALSQLMNSLGGGAFNGRA